MNQNFIKLITLFPDSIESLADTYPQDIWLLEQEILFQNNFVFAKRSHPNMALKYSTSEESNLFEMICLAIEKPLTYVEVLKEKIKEEISNIEKTLLLKQLEIEDPEYKIYFTNQNLKLFDSINCHLLHHILQSKICIYSLSNSMTLLCQIYNSNFNPTISLFKTIQGFYFLITETKADISSQIVLPILLKIISQLNYNKQLKHSLTASTYNDNASTQPPALKQLSLFSPDNNNTNNNNNNNEKKTSFAIQDCKQRDPKRRKQLTFKKSTTQEISLAQQQQQAQNSNQNLMPNNNLGMFFNSADEQNSDYLLGYDVWAHHQQQQTKSVISNSSPVLLDSMDQYYQNMFEQQQQQQIFPFNLSANSQENLAINSIPNLKFQQDNFQLNQFYPTSSPPLEVNQSQSNYYYNPQLQQQHKMPNSQFMQQTKSNQPQLQQSFPMNFPGISSPYGQQQNLKKHQIMEEPLEKLTGKLKYFDAHKNFGFINIEPDNQEVKLNTINYFIQVFFHYDDVSDPVLTKQQLLTFKIGNVMKFSFSLVKYVGKYNNSKKAIDIKLLSQYQVF